MLSVLNFATDALRGQYGPGVWHFGFRRSNTTVFLTCQKPGDGDWAQPKRYNLRDPLPVSAYSLLGSLEGSPSGPASPTVFCDSLTSSATDDGTYTGVFRVIFNSACTLIVTGSFVSAGIPPGWRAFADMRDISARPAGGIRLIFPAGDPRNADGWRAGTTDPRGPDMGIFITCDLPQPASYVMTNELRISNHVSPKKVFHVFNHWLCLVKCNSFALREGGLTANVCLSYELSDYTEIVVTGIFRAVPGSYLLRVAPEGEAGASGAQADSDSGAPSAQ